jgi:hypothetical protein
MKKTLSFVTLSLITFLAVFSFVPKSALADGMMIKPDPYSDRWDYSGENNQQAFINYDNGLQKMIISVGLEGENSEGVVWLFPIPSDPNKVAIDVVKSLPQLSGEEISKKAKSNLDDTTKFLQMTQLYTIPFISFYGTLGTTGKGWENSLGAPQGFGRGIEPDVAVYEHIDKEGISSEIITAKTANGLYDYFKSKGLKIESGSIPVLDNYIGKEYSFIASWISSPKQIISANQRGVFVTFPTKDIYFPLLPTSVYGSKTVPATIRIIGHVSPKVFQDIKSYTKTDYYVDSYASFADDLKNFYSGQNQNIKYTKIEINSPSKFLTDDLWINNQAPVKTYYSTFVAKHPIVSAIILFILSSIIAGILAGLIIFRDLRKNPIKLGFIGLSNFLTLLGLLITTVLVGTKNKNESVESLLVEIKQKGYFGKRRVATILFFVAIPFLVFGLFALYSLIREISYFGMRYFINGFVILILITCVLPISALIISFMIKRIKIEDRNLFEQLKFAGYSSWSFQPKDKMKYIFVPVFSVSFLIISWLLVKLVGFTV